jgi:hypothetical protein
VRRPGLTDVSSILYRWKRRLTYLPVRLRLLVRIGWSGSPPVETLPDCQPPAIDQGLVWRRQQRQLCADVLEQLEVALLDPEGEFAPMPHHLARKLYQLWTIKVNALSVFPMQCSAVFYHLSVVFPSEWKSRIHPPDRSSLRIISFTAVSWSAVIVKVTPNSLQVLRTSSV